VQFGSGGATRDYHRNWFGAGERKPNGKECGTSFVKTHVHL
jgi:hypothetical protein